MKKIFLQIYFLAILLLTNFVAFATTASGEIEDTPEDETPINTHLLWLIIAGISFAFYYFKNQEKKETQN